MAKKKRAEGAATRKVTVGHWRPPEFYLVTVYERCGAVWVPVSQIPWYQAQHALHDAGQCVEELKREGHAVETNIERVGEVWEVVKWSMN